MSPAHFSKRICATSNGTRVFSAIKQLITLANRSPRPVDLLARNLIDGALAGARCGGPGERYDCAKISLTPSADSCCCMNAPNSNERDVGMFPSAALPQ